jgi:hypothetical protein
METNKENLNINISLRDYIATECMKAEIISWNNEISIKYRQKLLTDMAVQYGYDVTVIEAIAMTSYEMADAMLNKRNIKD